MSNSFFIQIHYLTAYHASLLNRDDAGMAKRIPFGGTSRIRISSQCMKRHWRTADGEHSLKNLGVDMSVRSRAIFERMIAQPLIKKGYEEDMVRTVLRKFQANLLGESERRRGSTGGEQNDLHTSQVIVLGKPEIEFIRNSVEELIEGSTLKEAEKKAKEYFKNKEHTKNLDALRRAAGLDAALFGRMVTSDILARGDAAVHVAHAFTVHEEEAETDYFTAVDDLIAESGELGSAHINETELTSGIFYGYTVTDIPLLVSNLEGVKRDQWASADRTLAAKVIENLINLVATVTPGAKRGSTAPYSWAHLLLVEAGGRQPRTLANAYLEPVKPNLEMAVDALSHQLNGFDKMYGSEEERRVISVADISEFPAEKAESLQEIASWTADQVRSR